MPPTLLPKSTSSVLSSSTSICRSTTTRATQQQCRSFSATTKDEARTRQRRDMFKYLNGPGKGLKEPLEGSPCNYLGAYNARGEIRRPDLARPSLADLRPFPRNRDFVSEPITSEELRESIWKMIMVDGMSVKEVSAELGVEMSRVGAVVRLKEIEKDWQKSGQRLAMPYYRAITSMVPQSETGRKFESINDLPVHAATTQQIFWPTSEARSFSRVDAAKVFDDVLLPADKRVPHPELIITAKEEIQGIPPRERAANAAARTKAENERRAKIEERRAKKEAAAVKTVQGARWDFKFREIKVDDAGADGRGLNGTGWRYGAPLRDRIRGQIKIPTRV